MACSGCSQAEGVLTQAPWWETLRGALLPHSPTSTSGHLLGASSSSTQPLPELPAATLELEAPPVRGPGEFPCPGWGCSMGSSHPLAKPTDFRWSQFPFSYVMLHIQDMSQLLWEAAVGTGPAAAAELIAGVNGS